MHDNNDSRAGHAYYALTPDVVLNAVESLGYVCNGRLQALNSYENRVYQVGVENQRPVIAKFYRPNRWADAAILEEHAFTQLLNEHEIPVVAPIVHQDSTLHFFQAYRFAVYPSVGGRWPELDDPQRLQWMGRYIGRIHALASTIPFSYRPLLNVQTFGWGSLAFLLQSGQIPDELLPAYQAIAEHALHQVEAKYAMLEPLRLIRLHGDCHLGNILWTDDGPYFLDFDDARMGPAVQDIWMLLSGERAHMESQLGHILDGYSEFHYFDGLQLNLIEALRTLRLIHYSAWLAMRWDDPSFPQNFPWFATPRYWEEQILNLKEQAALMDEPPLSWVGF